MLGPATPEGVLDLPGRRAKGLGLGEPAGEKGRQVTGACP